MGKLKLLGDVVEGGLNAIKAAKRTPNEQKAAEKYAAGAQYADPLEPATMRMSEALGNAGAEGKTLNFTEADRSRVFGSNRGGVGFSGLQHYSLPHKEANTVWGFGNKLTAEKKVKQNDPEKHLWTTFVGAPTQHKSNTVVLQDAVKEFQKAVKEGKVHPAQIKLMNDRIRAAKDEKTGALLFDDAYDLTDPSALGAANSFARRSAVGDVLLGEGVKGPMRRKAFKEEHGDQSWHDSGKMESVLKRETDPDLVGAETYDVGNRLFVMDNGIIHRPDLNVAFPYQVTGNDLGMKFQLTPKEIAMRDWMKQYEGRLDKKNNPSPVSYMDLARNRPSQFVDEDYLTFLQKMGKKDGGAVEDFDAKVDKLIQNHHFDNHVDKRIKEHFAEGGDVKLARTSLRMAGGGMLGKGMAKLGKRLMADPAEVTASIKGGTRKFGDEAGGNTVVKDVGGNWLRDSTGSSLKTLKRKTQGGMKPEDALVQMRERFSDVPEQQQNIRSLEADVALNKWVDSNLNNYVKKQMGTPEDPVRKLAEEDITHFPIAEDPAFWERRGESSRKKLGGSKMAQSDLAQQWENRTDAIIKRDTAQEHQSMMRQAPGMYEKGDEWINKLAPETPLYTSIMNPRDLGFDHIMDVLREDLRAGRIRPEQLNKVSIEQAVRRTYEYDQEMARKMAEAQFKVTKGMPVKKEYPEGYKWIELKQPEISTELPPTHKIESYTSKTLGPMHRVVNTETGMRGEGFATPERALKEFYKGQSEEKLADALKYEGDTMGHCVGSYCDDVARGRSRIFSLRDSKGEPHVTIETQPRSLSTWDDVTAAVGPEESQKLWKEFDDIGGNNMSDVGQGFDMFIKQKGIKSPEKIIQIKGKGNAKPKEEYLPFVQDFVKSGKWSDVGDFKNTDLYKANPEELGMFLPASKDLQDLPVKRSELLQRAKQSGLFPEGQEYLTRSEWEDILRKQYQSEQQVEAARKSQMSKPFDEGDINKFMGGLEPEMARGGGVLKYTSLRNRNTTQSQPNRFADGGKSEMKATPRKKGYGVASDVLKGVHEFASKPFGYENPPVEFISELLGIPAASRVLDKLSYGEPITNAGKANVPLIPDDTFDAATAGLGGLGAASKLAKPLAKAAKKLPKDLPVGLSIKSVGDSPFGAPYEVPFSRGVKTLSREESDENLRKMLESSKIKERLYHATPEDIKFFKPGGLNPKISGEAIWLSNDPKRTPAAHHIGSYAKPRQGVNVMPVHVQAKNPMVLDDETMLKWAQEVYGEGSGEFPMLMPKKWREEVMKDYDSIILADPYKRGDSHEIIMFEPEKIKSAIGNRGTYNTDTADITKARGGPILKHTTLRNRRANQRVR
jgi:hypothetical protein